MQRKWKNLQKNTSYHSCHLTKENLNITINISKTITSVIKYSPTKKAKYTSMGFTNQETNLI